MKKAWTVFLGLMLLCGPAAAAERQGIDSEAGRINYSVGYQIGADFLRQGWVLDPELLLQGVRDGLAQSEPRISRKEMRTTLVNLKKKLTADELEKSRQAGAAFLAENAKKPGVVVLPSGVQYRVIREGTGKQPALTDQVTVRYQVRRFDAPGAAGGRAEASPKTYPLNKALPGLQEVLQRMKEGSVWEVLLPPGPALRSRGEALEGVGVLIYELELVSVQAGG